MAALNASDIPRRAILLFDAPNCLDWALAFMRDGWAIRVYDTGNPEPPVGRIQRRGRHFEMRRWSQTVTADENRVLYLEDDTLVPPDVWTRLSALLDMGYKAASGVQRGRHEDPLCGVWRRDGMMMSPFEPEGITEADAVGHYCLMTTGALYSGCALNPNLNEPIDCSHTCQMAPIAVDSAVWCGHLLESGEIVV